MPQVARSAAEHAAALCVRQLSIAVSDCHIGRLKINIRPSTAERPVPCRGFRPPPNSAPRSQQSGEQRQILLQLTPSSGASLFKCQGPAPKSLAWAAGWGCEMRLNSRSIRQHAEGRPFTPGCSHQSPPLTAATASRLISCRGLAGPAARVYHLFRAAPRPVGRWRHGLHYADVSHPQNVPGDAGRPRLPDHRCAPGMQRDACLLRCSWGFKTQRKSALPQAAIYAPESAGLLALQCAFYPCPCR